MKQMILASLLIAAATARAQEQAQPQLLEPDGFPALEATQAPQLFSQTLQLERATLATLAELEKQAATAENPEELQLRIHEVKRDAELRRLELLAVECRTVGRLDEAEQAEAELVRLQTPAPERQRAAILSPEEKQALEQLQQTEPLPAAGLVQPKGPSSQEGGN